uniref:Uncharacterized protein n=1 Tax=Arundo donax TaxID=35708 RepID=A0A0A8YX63_ARUDO
MSGRRRLLLGLLARCGRRPHGYNELIHLEPQFLHGLLQIQHLRVDLRPPTCQILHH